MDCTIQKLKNILNDLQDLLKRDAESVLPEQIINAMIFDIDYKIGKLSQTINAYTTVLNSLTVYNANNVVNVVKGE